METPCQDSNYKIHSINQRTFPFSNDDETFFCCHRPLLVCINKWTFVRSRVCLQSSSEWDSLLQLLCQEMRIEWQHIHQWLFSKTIPQWNMPGMNIEQLQPQRAKGGIRAAGQDRTLLHHLILRYWQLLDNSNKIEFSFKLVLKWSRRIKLFNWEISPFNQIHLTFPVLSTQFHKLQYNYPVLSSGLMISIENCLLGQVNWNGSRGGERKGSW